MENLRQLMAAYFHQDWFDEYSGSWEQAVDDFALREPERVAGVRNEIQQLLSSSSTDSDIDSALDSLGNYRWPGDAPTAYRDWLCSMWERLAKSPGQNIPSH